MLDCQQTEQIKPKQNETNSTFNVIFSKFRDRLTDITRSSRPRCWYQGHLRDDEVGLALDYILYTLPIIHVFCIDIEISLLPYRRRKALMFCGSSKRNSLGTSVIITRRSRGSSVSIVSNRLDDRPIGVRFAAETMGFFSVASMSRPPLRPTQPPIQCLPRFPSWGVKHGRGVTLTNHPHLVPRSIMSKSYTYSPSKRLYGV
jgi:hypothetical protein